MYSWVSFDLVSFVSQFFVCDDDDSLFNNTRSRFFVLFVNAWDHFFHLQPPKLLMVRIFSAELLT